MVKEAFPYGTTELYKGDETSFKVNGHRVKHYKERMPKEYMEGEDMILEENAAT